jgi:hypothetical protein
MSSCVTVDRIRKGVDGSMCGRCKAGGPSGNALAPVRRRAEEPPTGPGREGAGHPRMDARLSAQLRCAFSGVDADERSWLL